MTATTTNPMRKWSVVSGTSILIMAVAAGFAYGFVFPQYYVEGNPTETLSKINANMPLFYVGVLAWMIVVFTDFLVTYGFYVVLKGGNATWARATGITRLVYTLGLLTSVLFLATKNVEQFVTIWHLSLFLFFGAHLIVTGVGVFHEKTIPNLLAILLMIAGVGYVIVEGIQSLAAVKPSWFATLVNVLAVPMTIGELSFGLWLLVRGGKHKQVETTVTSE